MKLWLITCVVLLSGCVSTVITHDDHSSPTVVPDPVKVTSQPKVITRYKDRVVTKTVTAPNTCPKYTLPLIDEMPPVLVISDTASTKDRERDMALYIKTMRGYTATTLARIKQSYSDYTSKCK